jgi:aryl-alcohol dehydrogenase-like predicted oxidoreductase
MPTAGGSFVAQGNHGVERIDLLQLHTWTRAWNRDPTPFQLLRRLQEEGQLGLIGVSTPEHDQNSVIDLMRAGWVDAVQVIYNLFEEEPAAELLDVAQAGGVGVIVRVAFDEGALTGKFTAGTKFAPDDSARTISPATGWPALWRGWMRCARTSPAPA